MIFGNWLIFNALHFPHCPTLPDGWKIGKWPDLSESQITQIKGFHRLYCPHLPIQTACLVCRQTGLATASFLAGELPISRRLNMQGVITY